MYSYTYIHIPTAGPRCSLWSSRWDRRHTDPAAS